MFFSHTIPPTNNPGQLYNRTQSNSPKKFCQLHNRTFGSRAFCNFSQLPLSNSLFTVFFAYVVLFLSFFFFCLFCGEGFL